MSQILYVVLQAMVEKLLSAQWINLVCICIYVYFLRNIAAYILFMQTWKHALSAESCS